MQKTRLERLFLSNRRCDKKGLIVFVNAGDPDIDVTKQIIKVLDYNNVDAVELCVPFPNSFTDGEIILRSHSRALKNNISLDNVLEMVTSLRKKCKIPIVLLADYSHTVKPIGLEPFLYACKQAQLDGTLVHCLPPLLLEKYQSLSNSIGLDPIYSLYPKSNVEKRQKIFKIAHGFIYLVTTYGRTGKSKTTSNEIVNYIKTIRAETTHPLAVGFGIKTANDLKVMYKLGADAVIVGSAITSVIEQNLENQKEMMHALTSFVQNLVSV